jgi:hypothetical protein
MLQFPALNVCTGFCAVLNVSPVNHVRLLRFHTHEVPLLVEVSVNRTAVGSVPVVTFAVNVVLGFVVKVCHLNNLPEELVPP